MPSLRLAHVAAAVMLTAGCSSSVIVATPTADAAAGGGITAGTLAARAVASGVALKNQTEFPVALRVAERSFLARALYGPPCTGGPECSLLVQGAEATIPWQRVDGYDPNALEYVVTWWRILPDGRGGTVAGAPQTVVVTR